MLNSRIPVVTRTSMKGFSLIELMIAMVIGLIVVAAVISLILAINQANSETIQSTRLTQELRTLAAVIADDLKRTRRVDDPIGMVGQGTTSACAVAPVTPAQPCYPITPTTATSPATCATYGYTGTTTSSSIYNYHSVRRVVTGGVGSIVLNQLTFDPNSVAAGTALPTTAVVTACPITGSTATTLSSGQIDITALSFTAVSTAEIDLTLTGKLSAGDAYTKTITRTFTQPIFIRSNSPN